jgi:hypothetical protein
VNDYLYDLNRRIASAFIEHRRDTGLEPNPAHLPLRVHPDDYRGIVMSPGSRYASMLPSHLAGIAVVVDPTQAPGRPTLRSTWEMVL